MVTLWLSLETSAVVMVWLSHGQVLESFKIMDYSLLLGIHVLDQRPKVREAEPQTGGAGAGAAGVARGRPMSQKVLYSTALESIQGDGKVGEALTTDST